jgi:signal peptidase II
LKEASRALTLWLGLAAIVIAADQLTKTLILQWFQFGDVRPVTGFFNLVRAHNTGAAFSFLAGAGGWQRGLFIAIAVGAAVLIVHLLRRHPDDRLFCAGLALILGGALGNLWDRVVLGHVVDFVLAHAYGYHWPAFNVADSAITVGAGLLIWDGLFAKRAEGERKREA